jgi:hypothetical protein
VIVEDGALFELAKAAPASTAITTSTTCPATTGTEIP